MACLTDYVLHSEVNKALSKTAYELSLKWMNNYSSITNFIMTELSLITALYPQDTGEHENCTKIKNNGNKMITLITKSYY